jgi:hypothetical protein
MVSQWDANPDNCLVYDVADGIGTWASLHFIRKAARTEPLSAPLRNATIGSVSGIQPKTMR